MADMGWPSAGTGSCACRFVRKADFGECEQVEWCGRHAAERDEIKRLREIVDDLGLTPEAARAGLERSRANKRDAERYRELRRLKGSSGVAICELCDDDGEWYSLGMTDEAIDATVDAAIGKTMPAPTLICPRCRVDRFKAPCPAPTGNCPMMGEAQAHNARAGD